MPRRLAHTGPKRGCVRDGAAQKKKRMQHLIYSVCAVTLRRNCTERTLLLKCIALEVWVCTIIRGIHTDPELLFFPVLVLSGGSIFRNLRTKKKCLPDVNSDGSQRKNSACRRHGLNRQPLPSFGVARCSSWDELAAFSGTRRCQRPPEDAAG